MRLRAFSKLTLLTLACVSGLEGQLIPSGPTPVTSTLPTIVQKTSGVTGSGAKTVTTSNFTLPVQVGNTLVCAVGAGNYAASSWTPAFSDTLTLSWKQVASTVQSTTQYTQIVYAYITVGGTDAFTFSYSGASSANSGVSAYCYEVRGLLAVVTTSGGTLDAISGNSNAGSTGVDAGLLSPTAPNELAIGVVVAAGGTITAGTDWTLDSGTLTPTGGGNVSFGAESRITPYSFTYDATFTLGTSNAWAATSATFRTPILTTIAWAGLSVYNDGFHTGFYTACAAGCYPTIPDGTSFTAGGTNVTAAGFVFNDGLATLSSGTNAAARITSARGLHTNLRNNAGTEIGTASNPIQVSVANTGANGTAIAVGSTTLALDATLAKLTLAQASTTSGQTGPLIMGAVTTSAPTYSNGQTSPISLGTDGTLRTQVDNTVLVIPVGNASNGLTIATPIELQASDNHQNITTAASTLYHVSITNKGSVNQYVRFYNAGAGFNGCNSATNLKLEYIVPNATANGAGIVDDFPLGGAFSSGIAMCGTGAFGQTDTSSATASIVAVNLMYK